MLLQQVILNCWEHWKDYYQKEKPWSQTKSRDIKMALRLLKKQRLKLQWCKSNWKNYNRNLRRLLLKTNNCWSICKLIRKRQMQRKKYVRVKKSSAIFRGMRLILWGQVVKRIWIKYCHYWIKHQQPWIRSVKTIWLNWNLMWNRHQLRLLSWRVSVTFSDKTVISNLHLSSQGRWRRFKISGAIQRKIFWMLS